MLQPCCSTTVNLRLYIAVGVVLGEAEAEGVSVSRVRGLLLWRQPCMRAPAHEACVGTSILLLHNPEFRYPGLKDYDQTLSCLYALGQTFIPCLPSFCIFNGVNSLTFEGWDWDCDGPSPWIWSSRRVYLKQAQEGTTGTAGGLSKIGSRGTGQIRTSRFASLQSIPIINPCSSASSSISNPLVAQCYGSRHAGMYAASTTTKHVGTHAAFSTVL
jgi:hypothetical protein